MKGVHVVTTTTCAPHQQRAGAVASARQARCLPKSLMVTLVALGLAFLAIGIVYVAYQAGGLPPMFPGRNSGSTDHHLKHGVVSFAIAGTVWITAWVASWRPVEPQFAFRGAGL
jgi:hypothetical protein